MPDKPASIMPVHEPVIEDHGMWADHDMACPVCHRKHAVLNMNQGVFGPCERCESYGWEIRQKVDRLRHAEPLIAVVAIAAILALVNFMIVAFRSGD